MKFIRPILLLVLATVSLSAQLTNASLTGRYYFVHLLVAIDSGGEAAGAQNLGGTITFDGNGGFSFQGKLGIDSAAPSPSTGTGTYAVSPAGFVDLTNPIKQQWKINGRLGADSEIVLGASTEATDGSFDMFVALKAPADGVSNSALNGTYSGGSLWFPNGRDNAIKTSFLQLTPNGGGVFPGSRVIGHAADAAESTVEQPLTNATYTLNADGSGSASFGSSSSLLSGNHDVFVSANGNYFIGFSTEPGGREIFLAIKNFSNSANLASWNDNYWIAEILVDADANRYSMGSGSIRSHGQGQARLSERLRIQNSAIDFSGVNYYLLNANSTGNLAGIVVEDITNFAIGAPRDVPGAFVQAQVEAIGIATNGHGLTFGVLMPATTGQGPYISPIGVLNAASFAPVTYPISGGTIVSLFGTNLADSTQTAGSVPLPTSMANVSVTINDVLAPLFFVSPTQVNLQAPFALSGDTARIVLTNNGTASNEVQLPIAPTSPGIFSRSQDGLGPAIITHADFSLVTTEDPALPGETVIIFLTGLGQLDPPVTDGAAAPSDRLSFATDEQIDVLFGREAGIIQFAGAAPGFVGLYQINVTIPDTVLVGSAVFVAIQTSNGYSDMVDIAIGL